MSDSAPKSAWDSALGGIGLSAELRRHAFDPIAQPELFEGVLARRFVAFVIDLVIIALPLIGATIFIFILGLITFGVGWSLYWLLSPASVVWALFYYGATLGSAASATLGMRTMGIEMRTWYGAPCYFLLGAVHAIVYWISVSVLTPFVLLVGFFNQRKRLLHDMLVGTVVINNAAQGAALRTRIASYG